MSTLSMLLHSAGVYLRGAIFSGGNVWEGMVPGVISYCRRWSWWWWWWWWWCREKKQEFASLKAQSEDCFCFTSHAGFEVVRYISDHGLHVNLANSYNIGKCCCYLPASSAVAVFIFCRISYHVLLVVSAIAGNAFVLVACVAFVICNVAKNVWLASQQLQRSQCNFQRRSALTCRSCR